MEKEILGYIIERAQKLCFEEVTAETVLFDVGMNSLNSIGLIVDLEKEYNIKFRDEELSLGDLKTPQMLMELVMKKIA